MMHLQIQDNDDLAKEVIRHVASGEDGPRLERLERQKPEFYSELMEMIGNIWLIWIFRALVFNRSCEFIVPRRTGSGGKDYSLIPAKWLDSQIPVHIS